jgi:predicted DsbA family dithiol-disulfide isomerase
VALGWETSGFTRPPPPPEEDRVHVEIWSDIACPWCYIGKRRFEAALAAYEHRDEVTVTWRSFELDPAAPPSRDVDGATHLARKYAMSREEAVAMQDRMTQNAAGDGLDFRFDIARGGNTFDAHRIVHLAAAHGAQDAMKERIMRAYLSEGELISDHATLERLALEVGLPRDEVDEVLSSDRYAREVREDERTAARIGISAVPFFVVDRAIGASGAHPPEQLLELLRQARAANPPAAVATAAGGETCAVDTSGC